MFDRSTILAFHQTSRNFYPGINNIRPGYFFHIIALCREWGLTHWSATAATNRGEATRPNMVLTFGDGYEDNFEVMARLCEQGATPLVFIPTGFIGQQNRWEYSSGLFPARHLDGRQIRELTDLGVIIGSHGVTHNAFSGMSAARLERELSESKKRLEDITGRPVEYVSPPFGRINEQVITAARECGYSRAFGLGKVRAADDFGAFVLPRIGIYGIDNFYSLRGKILGNSRLEQFKDDTINGLASGTVIVSKRLN